MDNQEIVRSCRGHLRLLFAVDPSVGEAFAAANEEVLGRAISVPPKQLHLKLNSAENHLGEIDLIDFSHSPDKSSPGNSQSDIFIRLLGQLNATNAQEFLDGHAFLTDDEHRRRATAPARLTAREGIAALAISGNRGNTRAAMDKIFAAARWAEEAHAALKLTGRAASWYIGYAAIMTQAADLSPADFEAKIMPLFLKGGARQTTMLAWIAKVLCQSEAADRVANAADACLGKGMRQITEAYQAKDLEQFHTKLYGALPNLLAAFLLTGITNTASPAHARSSRSAELAILRALHTLQNAIADQPGLIMLRSYQSAIANIRAREGSGEAKRVALELTDMMMLYPAICKPILTGEVRL